jgi:hypothetical protein
MADEIFLSPVRGQTPTLDAHFATRGYNDGRYALLAHLHDAGDITTGMLAYARLPVGTGVNTVAAGNDSRIIGAIQASLATTKGDLIAASASATLARLGAGSDGQVLTVDSTQTLGIKWANPTGGGGGGVTINGTGYVTGLVPTGSATPTIQHNLGTTAIWVAVVEVATGLIVPVAAETVDSGGTVSANHVRLSFATAPTSGQYRYTVFAGAPVQAQMVPVAPSTLADAATIATDASLSTHFRMTSMTGDRTLGVPSNPTDAQRVLWELTADATDRTLTLSVDVLDGFERTTTAPNSTVFIPAGKTGFVAAIYSLARRRWSLLGASVTI